MKFIDGDFFEGISDYSFGDMYTKQITPTVDLINETYGRLNRTPILFIETHRIMELLSVVSNVKFDCIIICHNSDITLDDKIIKYIPRNVIKLWCQNYNGINNNIIKPLPIGLERKRWFPEQKKQKVLLDIEKDNYRSPKCYMNFNVDTNPVRKKWRDYLIDKDFIFSEMLGNGNDYNLYCKKMTEYKFTISPPGNGIDCHRNWEALYLKCIPIIQRSNFSESMFGDMNVILVDSYTDITDELLKQYEYNHLINDKISTIYWENMIKLDVRYS